MDRPFYKSDSQINNLLYCFLFVLLLIPSRSVSTHTGCKIGDYDVSLLNTKQPWISVGASNETYLFSICSAIEGNGCPAGSAVCQKAHDASLQGVKLGTFTNNPVFYEDPKKSITVTFFGQTCLFNHSTYFSTHIIFKCDKTLGSPVFLHRDDCTTVFEWNSIVACKRLSKPLKEVPCYVYVHGKQRDLTPLIKLTGAYKITSSSNVDIYINLCRDISSGNLCPRGAAACANISNTLVNLGEPGSSLRAIDSRTLQIKYETPLKPSICQNIPQTVINLICPKRGGSKSPIIVYEDKCRFDIEWLTEYACDEESINKAHTLKFSDPENDIDIDLTPLIPDKSKPYSVNATEPDHTMYTYYFGLRYSPNICNDHGTDFEQFNPAICQVKGSQLKYLGNFDHSTLRYSDDRLMLIYKGGQSCSSRFPRITFIEFHCNKSAVNDGKGNPVFRTAVDCSYYFDWDTKYACLDHPVLHSCSVSHNGKLFDLSSLRSPAGGNWDVINGHHYNSNADIFVNVCHDIIPEGKATGCSSDSAICMKDMQGKSVNLGRYTQGPVYNPVDGYIQLTYSEGDKCGDKKHKTIITFYCHPGQLNSIPVLISKSECNYYLEWHTAAACVQMQIFGANCRLSDDTLGYNFDLSPLIKNGTEKYEVSAKSYIYYLNVCKSVKGTACHSPTTGVCQTKSAEHFAKNTGVANGNLIYYNGILKLVYKDGDNYRTTPPASRTTVITFLCDMKSKIGHPEFIQEANMTYWFSWYTKYACTSPPVECTFKDKINNKQYDLSQLSLLHTNWNVQDNSDSNEKKTYYINVCRPLSHVIIQHGCSSVAGVCATHFVNGKEVIMNENLGQPISEPTLIDNGSDLVLRYTNGKQCIDSDNKTTNYSTTIHFRCKKTMLSNGPRFMNIEKNCEYVFLWETEIACAETNTESTHEDCTIKDPNSDYVFNLQPLIKKTGKYEINVKKRKLWLNICAPLTDSKCLANRTDSAVCEVQPLRSVGLASASSKLQLTDGHLRLIYTGKQFISGEVFQAIIIFVCDPEHDLGSISFINSSQQMYTFQFNTALACVPRPVDCILHDQKGGQYDLTRLALPNSNWETTVDGTKYIINICRPVNKKNNVTCAGLVGGCQITKDKRAFNIGYVQSKPIALSDGTVSIRYRGGDICHKGTDKESHRSTRIDFFCSSMEEGIQFQSETAYCEYVFSWKTPAACVVRRVEGDDCKVVDPLYHNLFDLSPLRNNASDYKVETKSYTFYINVCGPLVSSSYCEKGTAACQVNPTLKMKIGSPNKKLIYDDGAIILKYENGQANCHKRFTRKTIITFTCDHLASDLEGPRYLNEAEDCTYLFEWPTRYACPKMVSTHCKVQNSKGQLFDLSNLALSNSSYVYVSPRLAGQKFILNVCHSLVHKKGETCPFNAASCRITNETDPLKRYHNIGQVGVHPLQFNNGYLELVYENGEPCQGPIKKNSSTHIKFVCDMNALDTTPGDYSVNHGCEHHFIWVTREACPIEDIITSNNTCVITNPTTDITFDLSRLRSPNGYSVSDRVGHNFMLNVCGKVKSNCADSSGSCQTDMFNKSFNAGNANAKLHLRNGIVSLNYTGGDKCHQGKFNRNTIISFVCNPSANLGEPLFIDESDDCTYYFSWHTNLVCDKQVPCSVADGSQLIDLSPLIKMSENHVAQLLSFSSDPGASFYINICRPLNPIPGSLCPPKASICRVKESEKPLSVGAVNSGPYIDGNDQKVTMLYVLGDKCPDGIRNRSSLIKFTCNPGHSVGHPVLIEVFDNCIYIFNWETYVVCPVSTPHKDTNCTYTDTRSLTDYDLSPLKKAGVQTIPNRYGFYKLSVCAATSNQHNACNSSGVCHVDSTGAETPFGDVHKAMFSMQTDLVTLSYKNRQECNETKDCGRCDDPGSSSGSGPNLPCPPTTGYCCTLTGTHPSSKIHFLCDANAGIGKPILFSEMTCEVAFLWKTKYACPPVVKECFLSHLGYNYDLSVLANTHSWKALDLFGNIYWINVCQALHSRPKSTQCPGNAAVCMQKNYDTVVTLGTVSSQVLYVDIRTPVTQPVIILQYSSEKPVCGNKKAKTLIRFSCANVIGTPRFSHKSQDNCTYEFVWKTRIACKEKRIPISDENGILTDPRSPGKIYFANLTRGKTFHAIEFKGPVLYKYSINFDGRLRLDPSKETSSVCQGAAVCQTKPSDALYYKNLGSAQNKNFYLDVESVDLEITSPEKCRSNSSKNVKTIFEFFCSHLASSENPKFVYESKECVFLFTWTSSIACFQHDNTNFNETVETTKKTSNASSKAIGVIGVIVSLFILSILILVLSRPEKRAYMMEKMKGLFTRNRAYRARYINISQMDEDEGLLVMESEGGATSVPYHDDSDEDLILS